MSQKKKNIPPQFVHLLWRRIRGHGQKRSHGASIIIVVHFVYCLDNKGLEGIQRNIRSGAGVSFQNFPDWVVEMLVIGAAEIRFNSSLTVVFTNFSPIWSFLAIFLKDRLGLCRNFSISSTLCLVLPADRGRPLLGWSTAIDRTISHAFLGSPKISSTSSAWSSWRGVNQWRWTQRSNWERAKCWKVNDIGRKGPQWNTRK